jgi:hypothetical protein
LRDGETIRQISARLKIPRSTLADALSGKGHYEKALPGVVKATVAGSSG